jgi:signal transduction histidine kinase
LLVIYFSIERNWRERERKALAEREAERQSYTRQVLKVQEDERRRIAQELHDDPTQTLLVIANRAQALVSDGLAADEPEKKRELEWIRDTTVAVSESLKRICLDLRPSVLDDLGLVPALTWAVEDFNRLTQIKARLELEGSPFKLSPEKEVTLFRIVQEALSNVWRHSQATRALVSVAFRPDKVTIVVQDNGKGFPVEKRTATAIANGKLGLLGMRERSQLINGSFNIQSEPGQGTRVFVQVQAQQNQ